MLEHFFAWMTRCETAVICRMPILSRDHERECRLQFIRDWEHRVSVWYGQRAAGQEVVLNIHQYQCFHQI